jgi:hypothetical protein
MLVYHADPEPAGFSRRSREHGRTGEEHPTRIRQQESPRDTHQRRLPRPVFAQQGMELPGGESKVGVVKCLHGAECLVDALEAQRLGHLVWSISVTIHRPVGCA